MYTAIREYLEHIKSKFAIGKYSTKHASNFEFKLFRANSQLECLNLPSVALSRTVP